MLTDGWRNGQTYTKADAYVAKSGCQGDVSCKVWWLFSLVVDQNTNFDINVELRHKCWQTDGRTENRTPISHPATSRCDKNVTSKNWQFYKKKTNKKNWYFSYFCPKHSEVVPMSTHNLCFRAEITKKNCIVFPFKSQFYYIKVGFKGVKIM